jgi:hypothetical protein
MNKIWSLTLYPVSSATSFLIQPQKQTVQASGSDWNPHDPRSRVSIKVLAPDEQGAGAAPAKV